MARPNHAAHWYSAPLAGPFDYAFNADSAAFARLVVRFPRGFTNCEQGRVRLLRPLYPALGWLAWQPLRLLEPLIPDGLEARAASVMGRANHPEIWQGVRPRDVLAAWAALVLVNVLLYWLALAWIFRALVRVFPPGLALPLALLPAFHFDAVDFLLVPHTEVFNPLIPALALRVMTSGRAASRASALVLGVLLLGKGILFPFASWVCSSWRKTAVFLAYAAAPLALYAVLLGTYRVSLYSHEMSEGHQGVWMLEAVRAGEAASIPARWLGALAAHLVNLTRGFWIPLLGCALLLLRPKLKAVPVSGDLARHLGVYALSCAGFWVLMGGEQVRHSVLAFPWIVVALGALAASRLERPAKLIWMLVGLQVLGVLAGMFRY